MADRGLGARQGRYRSVATSSDAVPARSPDAVPVNSVAPNAVCGGVADPVSRHMPMDPSLLPKSRDLTTGRFVKQPKGE